MNKKFALSGIFLVLFLVLMVLLGMVDVAAIGPNGTEVGFSKINAMVHQFTNVNFTIYKITDVTGYAICSIVAIFGLLGFVQLIKRKSFAKVDKEIYALFGLYVLLGTIYVAFEKMIINYRPVIKPGHTEVEASFPSSHTMLSIAVGGSAILLIGKYIKSESTANALRVIVGILILITLFGRLISGVHWFTDIIGGIFISLALVFGFWGVLDGLNSKYPAGNK